MTIIVFINLLDMGCQPKHNGGGGAAKPTLQEESCRNHKEKDKIKSLFNTLIAQNFPNLHIMQKCLVLNNK